MTKAPSAPDTSHDDEPSRWDTFARAFRSDDFVGTIVDRRYQITARIGAGGMGVVYRAQHLALDRPVAVKVLHAALADDPDIRARFLREARAAARINSPHVVSVIDFGPHDARDIGPLFLVMELLEGEDLAQTLKRVGPMPWPRAAEVITQVCLALHAAHEQGVIHRDIKPQNCYRLTSSNQLEARVDASARAVDHIKVLDFGMARLDVPEGKGKGSGRGNSEPWTIGGTRGYIAPEVLRGEQADLRVDIYGVGALLCRLLTNRPPHAVLARIIAGINAADGPDPVLPAGVLPIVRRAMANDPNRRFSSALELAEAVRTVYEVHSEIRERDHTPASPRAPDAARELDEVSTLQPVKPPPRRQESASTPASSQRREDSADAVTHASAPPRSRVAPPSKPVLLTNKVSRSTPASPPRPDPTSSPSSSSSSSSASFSAPSSSGLRPRPRAKSERVVVDLRRGPSFDVLAYMAARLARGAPERMTRRFADLKPGFTGRERRLRFALGERGLAIEAFPHLFHGPERTSYPALSVRELATLEAGTVLYCPRGVSLSPRFVIRAKLSDSVVVISLYPAGAMRDRIEFVLEGAGGGADQADGGRARKTRGESRW